MQEPNTGELEWDDVVLDPSTFEQVLRIESEIRHATEVRQSSRSLGHSELGYRCLFCGPSGTGKATTALVLGRKLARPAFRVELSALVSKYIGETEKNLERILSQAQDIDCILLFDEADALFSRRTEAHDARSRYANAEVSWLLQNLEQFNGVVVLATNSIDTMDAAFLRRFHGTYSGSLRYQCTVLPGSRSGATPISSWSPS